MTSDHQDPNAPRDGDPPGPKPEPEDAPLQNLFRVLRRFLVPFMFSWALAYVGSARDIEWLHYTGLGGVTLCLIVLMIWLIS